MPDEIEGGKPTLNVIEGGEVELARRKRRRVDDPAPHLPRGKERIPPNAKNQQPLWKPDKFGLPIDPPCPVQALGFDHEFKYLIDSDGQLRSWTKSDFNQQGIADLFSAQPNYPKWAWPRHGRRMKVFENGETKTIIPIESFKADDVRDALFNACSIAGHFDPRDKVRGRGMWGTETGAPLYHAGQELWLFDHKQNRPIGMPTGDWQGYIYPRMPGLAAPWSKPLDPDDNPSGALIEIYRTWNWERPVIDPVLMLGHNVVGYAGGALAWRSAVLLLGDKGTGKSALQNGLVALFGDAIFPTANTTAAGIYQDMRQDNRLVAVDELEPDGDPRRVKDLTDLMRIAASGTFARRGGSDGTPTSYQLRCAFLFSAINNPLHSSQDLSRVAVLRLQPPKGMGGKPPTIHDSAGKKLLHVLMREFPRFEATYALYRAALKDGGHDGRGLDTYGTLLALADIVQNPEQADALGIPLAHTLEGKENSDGLAWWRDNLAADRLPELESATANWRGALEWALTNPVEPWRSGGRPSVGARIAECEATEARGGMEGYDRGSMTRDLGDAGLGILPVNEIIGRKMRKAGCGEGEAAHALGLVEPDGQSTVRGFVLAIPFDHPGTRKLFAGSPWQMGAWTEALRQCPHAGIMSTDRDVNRLSVGGTLKRCTLIVLERYRGAPER